MKSLVEELIEDKEFDKQIVKTFYSKSTLSPDIFHEIEGGYKMDEGVRDKLLNVANTFVEYIGVPFFIYDVVLTGSLANYNWSEYSDVDLHILIDLNEFGVGDSSSMSIIMKEFFDSKKNNWNGAHDIKIKGYDVELYVQDISEKHLSSGVYSILNDNWVIEPQKGKKGIDVRKILEKGEEYGQIIDDLLGKFKTGSDITPEIEDVRRKLKNFRQSGLENGGEYSYENLTFKLLRRNGYIEKLLNLKKRISDKKLSINEGFDYSDALKIEKAAIKHYGVTDNYQLAGYITPSGYLLDFSEGNNFRVQDHRNIEYILQTLNINTDQYDKNIDSRSDTMFLIMDMGFIRFLPESNSFDMHTLPTQEQFEIIREIIKREKGEVIIEMNEDAYVEYEKGTPEEVIINGIKKYYKEGIKPKSFQHIDDEEIW